MSQSCLVGNYLPSYKAVHHLVSINIRDRDVELSLLCTIVSRFLICRTDHVGFTATVNKLQISFDFQSISV